MPGPEEYRFCPACGAALETREVAGRPRPVCPSCGRVQFLDPKVAAAVLLEQEGKVLLVRRGLEPEQGKWGLPAGFVDRGEDPRRAAERECAEETGLVVRVEDIFEIAYGAEHPAGADLVLVYRARFVAGDLQARDDADKAAFFPPEDLPPLAFKATRQAIERWRLNPS